jgi:hypothetical protein
MCVPSGLSGQNEMVSWETGELDKSLLLGGGKLKGFTSTQ